MGRRYLFGPVSRHFAEQYLQAERTSGDCLAFGPDAGLDLDIGANDDWHSVCAKLPSDKQPEFLVLYAQYRTIPPWLWSAPVPIITLAGDWNLNWHAYRQLRRCDLVLTDALGAEVMRRDGIEQVRSAILFGGERDFLQASWPDVRRDIDILFVGNFNTAVQRERLPHLGRVASLGQKWNVVIATNVFGDDYRKLLARTRIAVNRGIRSEWNLRVTEALAAGALLFQEEGNREVMAHLRDRQECVYYNADNLESLMEHYLERESERHAIAEAGRARLPEFSFHRFWHESLDAIDAEWTSLLERSKNRHVPSEVNVLFARAWQAYAATSSYDPSLIGDLDRYDRKHPSSMISNALGYAQAMLSAHGGAHVAGIVLPDFQRAWTLDGRNFIAGLNLAEAYTELGRRGEAVQQARAVLAALETSSLLDTAALLSPHFPVDFDVFRVEWERAAWQHPGDADGLAQAKRNLLRWRLHLLLADLTDDLAHYEQAAQIRPDLPHTQGALGCAYARKGRLADAVAPLQQTLDLNPFDRQAARALFQVLKELSRNPELEKLTRLRRLLHKAAPQIVPDEPWFHEESKPQPVVVTETDAYVEEALVSYQHGKAAFAENRFADAIDHLERCLHLSPVDDPRLAQVYLLIACGYQKLEKLVDALVACRHGLKLFPNDAELRALHATLVERRKAPAAST